MFRHATTLVVSLLIALTGCRRGPSAEAAAAGSPAQAAAASDGAAPASAIEAGAGGPNVEAADAGAGDDGQAAARAAGRAPAAEDAPGPFLWRVEGATPTYLFGTIHVPDERVLALPPSVEQAFAKADAVYTEIPMDAGTQMSVMGKIMLPEGEKLSDVIGERTFQRMTAVVEKTLGNAPAGTGAMLGTLFERMKPWAAMSQLSLLEFLPDMLAGRQPLDAMLYARAQAEGKRVGALETPEEQIAVFESFTLAEQTRMLELTLDEMERVKPGGKTQTQELIEAYLSGDMNVVAGVMEEAMTGDRALMTRFRQIAIDKRNTHMTERIRALRAKEPSKVFFVAVGTAHFAGDTGIVAQLQRAGLTVSRVR